MDVNTRVALGLLYTRAEGPRAVAGKAIRQNEREKQMPRGCYGRRLVVRLVEGCLVGSVGMHRDASLLPAYLTVE